VVVFAETLAIDLLKTSSTGTVELIRKELDHRARAAFARGIS
jgi:hypothetical protein